MMKVEDYVRGNDSVYILKSVTAKNGELRDIHKDLKIGGVWCLDGLMDDFRPVCLCEVNYDPGYMRHIYLSEIESVVDDDTTKTVTTMNTIYVFEKGGAR